MQIHLNYGWHCYLKLNSLSFLHAVSTIIEQKFYRCKHNFGSSSVIMLRLLCSVISFERLNIFYSVMFLSLFFSVFNSACRRSSNLLTSYKFITSFYCKVPTELPFFTNFGGNGSKRM